MIDVVLPLPQISNVYALDVDRHTGDIYWADNVQDTIIRSSSNGKNIAEILGESMDSVDGLVICSVTLKVRFMGSLHHESYRNIQGDSKDFEKLRNFKKLQKHLKS
jgi:hypothetical protein